MNILYILLAVASFSRLFATTSIGSNVIHMVLLMLVINLALSPMVSKRFVIGVFILGLYCLLEMYGSLIGLLDLDLKALFLLFLTMFSLLISSSQIDDSKSLCRFIFYSAFTVPVSILLVAFSDFSLPIKQAAGSKVFGFYQLTYFFYEPSHYAVFLALCLSIALQIKASATCKVVLLFGLILTWSISGFIFAAILLGQSFFIKKTFHYIILFAVLCTGYFLLSYIKLQLTADDYNFIILNKFLTLFDYVDGSEKATSAGVRMFSSLLGPIYVFEQFLNEDYIKLFLGEGIGGSGDWIYMQFQDNFIDNNMERMVTYNFFSSILIFGGVLGIMIYFMFFIICAWPFLNSRLYIYKYIVSIFSLAMLSGYAYGILAFLFFSLIVVNAGVSSRVFTNRMPTI